MLARIFGGHRPDITPAQVVGGAFASVGPVCVLLGVHLSKIQLGAVDDLKLIALGLIGADAAVRIGRNIKDGKVEAAALSSPTVPPDAIGDVPAGHTVSVSKTVVGPDGATSVHLNGEEIAAAVATHAESEPPITPAFTGTVPEEAPFSEDEIDNLPPEVSSDPEADALDEADLPSDDDEQLTIGPHTPEEVQ